MSIKSGQLKERYVQEERYVRFRQSFGKFRDDVFPNFKEETNKTLLQLKYTITDFPEFKDTITKSLVGLGFKTDELKDSLIKNINRLDQTRVELYKLKEKVDNIGKINTKPILDDILKKGFIFLLVFVLGGFFVNDTFLNRTFSRNYVITKTN